MGLQKLVGLVRTQPRSHQQQFVVALGGQEFGELLQVRDGPGSLAALLLGGLDDLVDFFLLRLQSLLALLQFDQLSVVGLH